MGQAYTCFVAVPRITVKREDGANPKNVDVDRRVVELDGTRAGPVDRGLCTDLLEVRSPSFCLS